MDRLGAFCIPAAHPCLAGHFPGRPVVPGVVLLDEIVSILAATYPGRLAGLPRVKFTHPVSPQQDVAVHAAAGQGGRVAFLCRVGERDVLAGTLLLGPV